MLPNTGCRAAFQPNKISQEKHKRTEIPAGLLAGSVRLMEQWGGCVGRLIQTQEPRASKIPHQPCLGWGWDGVSHHSDLQTPAEVKPNGWTIANLRL